MANFKQCIEWMKEGKKVRRPHWKEFGEGNYHIFSMNNEIFFPENRSSDRLCVIDFEATDWEIYGEEDKWSYIAINEYPSPNSDIAVLKQKILQDINNIQEWLCDDDAEIPRIEIKQILDKRFGF